LYWSGRPLSMRMYLWGEVSAGLGIAPTDA
jgi:hypothetical protein